jgi:2-oxoglutarate ferredoxin oxidoreductase subunit beta
MKTKAAIKKAFETQMAGKGFSLVEVVSNCPTNWGMSPLETINYMNEYTLKEFPLGEFRAK